MSRMFLPWITAAMAALCTNVGHAQTGLLLVADSAADDLRLGAAVTWAHGPMHMVADPDVRLDEIDATLARWRADGITTVVIIPLTVSAESRLPRSIRRALDEGDIGVGTVASVSPAVRFGAATADGVPVAVTAAAKRSFDMLVADGVVREPGSAYRLSAVNVTATRVVRDGFDTPMSVTTFGRETIREQAANGAADLFRDVPGLDVIGVGTSQPRPVIRGLLGQRILLLQDGIRLGNSRREQDRGELPGLVDISRVQRYEVVRGASSILYGSDAIGGVVNMIVSQPDWESDRAVHGSIGYRYSTADKQSRPTADLDGTFGRLNLRLAGSYRRADPYSAPSGTFGSVTLGSDTRVEDTGVRDHSIEGALAYRLGAGQSVFVRYERYQQKEAGFGFVEPEVFGEASRVQILFPRHGFDKVTAGYTGTNARLPFADDIDAVGYWQRNAREMQTNVFTPIGNGATLTVQSDNYTDLRTYGGRVELKKYVAGRHALTYGADFFRDRSENADTSTRTVEGFGPPRVTGSGTPRVPYARFASVGAFAQADMQLTTRLNTVLGIRYQYVRTTTDSTPGLTDPLVRGSDQTVVGAMNVQYRLTDALGVVASVGRGFRSANLVERFYAGPSPEGRGYWRNNPGLEPETSWNLEGGVKVRTNRVHGTAFVFRNTIANGIALRATGDSVNGVVEYQNVNVDELRFSGIEVLGGVTVWRGLSANIGFARLWTADLNDPTVFVGESYATKWTGALRYMDRQGRFWAEYGIRHHGSRDDVDLGNSVVGVAIPSFTVHHVRAGVRLLQHHAITAGIDNLTNTLYAEAPNVAFFRPEPRRNFVVSWRSAF